MTSKRYLRARIFASPHFQPRFLKGYSSGKLFHQYGGGSLLEKATGMVYKPLEGSPEEYDGTLKIGDTWYIHNRRHLTLSMLRADLEGAGFRVLYQDGEYGENVVCVLPDATVRLRSISEIQ